MREESREFEVFRLLGSSIMFCFRSLLLFSHFYAFILVWILLGGTE